MRYLLMCCFAEDRWEKIPEPERDAIMQEYSAWIQDIERSGHHIATGKLRPSSAATTIRAKDGKRVITDGPFAETKEQLGGYHLIECKDLDEAIAIAGNIPTLRVGGTIEVRPVEPTAETS
jgi:hypothetical protein